MSDLKQAQLMLDMARKDLKALKGMLDQDIFEEEIFGFHAQQAIEKALKGRIALMGHEYPLTHDISTLLEFLENRGQEVEPFWDFVEFNAFSVRFRYETFDALEEPINRKGTIEKIEDLLRQVEKQISPK
ncbi:HEPN domain-containing protein [Thermodesulfobacteriota bacterium]